jgi:hypothetical protein
VIVNVQWDWDTETKLLPKEGHLFHRAIIYSMSSKDVLLCSFIMGEGERKHVFSSMRVKVCHILIKVTR